MWFGVVYGNPLIFLVLMRGLGRADILLLDMEWFLRLIILPMKMSPYFVGSLKIMILNSYHKHFPYLYFGLINNFLFFLRQFMNEYPLDG